MEKHKEDCLSMIHEIGQCTCDAMMDEKIDAELLEKEEVKD